MNNEFDNNNIETTNIQNVTKPKSNKKIILIVLFVLILLVSAAIVLYTQTDIFKKDKETNNNPKTSEKNKNTNTQINDDVIDNDDVDDEYDGENLAEYRYLFKEAKNSCITYGSTEENESGYITYVSDINIDGKNYKLAYGNDYSKQYGIRTLNGKHIEGFDTNTNEMLPVSLCVYGKYIVLQTGWEGAYTHVISTEGKSITGFGGTYEVIGENKIHIDEYDCSVDTNGKYADSHNEYDIDFNSNPLEKLNLNQTYYNCDEAPF